MCVISDICQLHAAMGPSTTGQKVAEKENVENKRLGSHLVLPRGMFW